MKDRRRTDGKGAGYHRWRTPWRRLSSFVRPAFLLATAVLLFSGCSGVATERILASPLPVTLRSIVPGSTATPVQQVEQVHPASHAPTINATWDAWAQSHIKNGDLVFMRGDCRILLGLVDFSEFSTDLTESPYSHIGVAAVERDEVVVYDIRAEGMKRSRFSDLALNQEVHSLAIKRLRSEQAGCIPDALAYCRGILEERGKFDEDFKLDNDRLYCSELVELAFRSGGQTLSEPIAIRDLPGFDRHPKTIRMIQLATRIEPDQEIFLPGNSRYGIWACPDLVLVAEVRDTSEPPPAIEK